MVCIPAAEPPGFAVNKAGLPANILGTHAAPRTLYNFCTTQTLLLLITASNGRSTNIFLLMDISVVAAN